MKTYVLLISRYFPATHPRKGEPTFFHAKIWKGLCDNSYYFQPMKIHTIRANYDLWKKRIDEVNAGEAVLSLRYWTDNPYNSKQKEFARLGKDSGIGVQKICFPKNSDPVVYDDFGYLCKVGKTILAKNDGLSFDDFEAWFKGYDLSKPMAIIHFTDFRY
jgi:hypothetical protein